MMRMAVPVMLLFLGGCGSGSQAPSPAATAAPSETPSPMAPTAAPTRTTTALAPTLTHSPEATQSTAALNSRDCRTVAQAYFEAVARNDFTTAARVWNDPTVDAARLKARFTNYAVPQIEISKVREEGAAGSLYCTVTGKLTDVANVSKAPQAGEIVLRRVNDVPGATPDQLRWTIRSSTFLGKLEHSAK